MTVQHGQITTTANGLRVVHRAQANGTFVANYWDATAGAELIPNGGGLFVAGSNGITESRSLGLAVTSIVPISGSRLGAGDLIRIQLNNLINTDPLHLRNAISVSDGDGVQLAADMFTLNGVNTLAGGYIEVGIIGSGIASNKVRINITNNLRATNGETLISVATANYD